MPEGLATADGTAIDLERSEQEFARAMAAPEPDEPEHAAPPKRQQLSEEELGAKYGWTTGPDGERRAKRAKGRPSTRPRQTTAPAADGKPAKGGKTPGDPAAKPDLSGPLTEFTSALWMVMAASPIPSDGIRIKVRAQAKVLRENQGGLCQGINLMAQHNGTIRRGVELLTTGNAGWVLPACMALAPFAVQSASVWKSSPADLVALSAETEAEWAEEFASMKAEMGLGPQDEGADINERAGIHPEAA